MLPPVSADEALELLYFAESYYADAFKAFDEDETFYEGKLEDFVEVPEGFELIIPTTARAVVDEAVDNVAPDDIIVFYPPRKQTQTAEKDADTIRRWTRGLWQHWRRKNSDIDIVRDFIKNLFMSGKAIFKVAPDWTLWPQLSDKVEKELLEKNDGGKELESTVALIERVRAENTPIFCRSISPTCIMEDPTVGPRKLWVVERYQASIAEVRSTYSADVEDLRSTFWQLEYPVHEVWTATYIGWDGKLHRGKHWVFVNWDMVREEENPYDDVPYIIKHSGFGRESYQGKPETKAVGFYTRQTKSMFLAEMRRHMHFDAIMSQVAYPIAFLPDDVEDVEIDFTPGSVNYVAASVMQHLSNMWQVPQIPHPEYLQSLSAIGNQIERGTVQRALRGAGVPGTDSAAQYNAITNQAKMRIEPVKQATEEALSEVTAMALKYVDREFGDDISVFVGEEKSNSYTIGPKNIQGHYTVRVQFQPNEEAVKERKLLLANDAIAKGGLSRYDAYTFAGFENPWELIERKDADDLMQEPVIKRALAKKILEGWGIDIKEIEIEEQMEQMQQQFALRDYANQFQLGGAPGAAGNGAMQPPQMPQGDPGAGMFAPPPGAPPVQQNAPVADLQADIASLQGPGI